MQSRFKSTTNSWLKVLLGLLLWLGSSAPSAAEPAVEVDISVRPQLLPGEVHYSGAPLLLSVSIINSSAHQWGRIDQRNADLRQRLQRNPTFSALSNGQQQSVLAELAPQSPPSIVLGSTKQPLHTLVRISLVDGSGKPSALPIRPLASNNALPARMVLDERNSAQLHFGIDQSALARLPAGSYRLLANLDTRKTSGMWQGEAHSPEFSFSLSGKAPGLTEMSNAVDYLSAHFFYLDGQLDLAEQAAQRIVQRQRGFLSQAYEIKGDISLARGDENSALDYYDKSIQAYKERVKELEVTMKHVGANSNNPVNPLEGFEIELPQQLYEKRAVLLERKAG